MKNSHASISYIERSANWILDFERSVKLTHFSKSLVNYKACWIQNWKPLITCIYCSNYSFYLRKRVSELILISRIVYSSFFFCVWALLQSSNTALNNGPYGPYGPRPRREKEWINNISSKVIVGRYYFF